jgi:hypothetical protein
VMYSGSSSPWRQWAWRQRHCRLVFCVVDEQSARRGR